MAGYDSNVVPAREGSAEAVWLFPRDDGLDKLVASYVSGDHKVNPKQFMQSLSKTRKQLHNFMNNLHS